MAIFSDVLQDLFAYQLSHREFLITLMEPRLQYWSGVEELQ